MFTYSTHASDTVMLPYQDLPPPPTVASLMYSAYVYSGRNWTGLTDLTHPGQLPPE